MRRIVLSALAVVALSLFASACASSGKGPTAHDSGSKTLHATVTERQYDPGTAGYRTSGTYYLSFEAEDGDKTVHYRFPVSQQQYGRYPEGTRVTLILLDEQLRDIRPAQD
ncbi:MAG TPA: hypothetical protein VIA45_04950 [Thermoanaerobaculia bacterium]|jgi:outer membrane lipoprotein-sorting protein